MSPIANSSQRVLRSQKTQQDVIDYGHVLRSGKRISETSMSVKKTPKARPRKKKAAVSESTVPSVELGSKLPLELWSLIFDYLDNSADLARVSRLCRFVQYEAESMLYRFAHLEKVPRVRKFHRAISTSPRRAATIRSLGISDNGHFQNVASMINDILQLARNVTDLELHLFLNDRGQVDSLYTQLKQCTFQLKRLNTTLDLVSGGFDFLAHQPTIERLSVKSGLWHVPNTALSPDVLPHLRILSVNASLIPVMRHIHSITHLDIFLPSRDTIDTAFQLFGRHLISFRAVRLTQSADPNISKFPINLISNVMAPALRFAEIRDITLANYVPLGENENIDVTNMFGPEVVVERFLWAPDWHPDEVPLADMCLVDVRKFAKAVLQTWKTLRQFVYVKSAGHYTSCALTKDGELVEQEDAKIKEWDEV